MAADPWALVHELATRAPVEITIAVLLGALRQDEARLEADQRAVSHAPGTWLPPVPAPPKRKPGRPPGRKRRSKLGRKRTQLARVNGEGHRVSKKPAKPTPGARVSDGPTLAEPAQDNTKAANGHGRTKDTAAILEARKVGAAFWRAAAALDNGRPWIPVARAFGLNEQVCLDAKRIYELPVGVSREMAQEFIGAEAPAAS